MKKRFLLICVLVASLSPVGYAQKTKVAPRRGAKPQAEQKEFQDNREAMPRHGGPMHGRCMESGPGMPPPPPPGCPCCMQMHGRQHGPGMGMPTGERPPMKDGNQNPERQKSDR